MQKITVVGADSSAKTAIIISLNSSLEIISLRPDAVSFFKNQDDLVIYVTESVDRQIYNRLRASCKGLVLVSRTKLESSDLFIPIATLQNLAGCGILKEIQSLRDFIDKSLSDKLELSNLQRAVLSQLPKNFTEEEALLELSISRRTYYDTLAKLRLLYGVDKNWQLVQITQS